MRTVVDASLVAKWYFPERGHSMAESILEQSIDGELRLLAPNLIEYELTNLLWKKVRREECSAEVAEEVHALWRTDRPRLLQAELLSQRALDLALALGHPAYDCFYLAAAIEYEAMLATADARLARAGRGVVAEIVLIGE